MSPRYDCVSGRNTSGPAADFERAVPDVRDDADDLGAVLEAALSDREPLADGRLARPVRAGRRFVDQRDLGLADAIVVGEVAALEDRNPQRLEVTRRCPGDADKLALCRPAAAAETRSSCRCTLRTPACRSPSRRTRLQESRECARGERC